MGNIKSKLHQRNCNDNKSSTTETNLENLSHVTENSQEKIISLGSLINGGDECISCSKYETGSSFILKIMKQSFNENALHKVTHRFQESLYFSPLAVDYHFQSNSFPFTRNGISHNFMVYLFEPNELPSFSRINRNIDFDSPEHTHAWLAVVLVVEDPESNFNQYQFILENLLNTHAFNDSEDNEISRTNSSTRIDSLNFISSLSSQIPFSKDSRAHGCFYALNEMEYETLKNQDSFSIHRVSPVRICFSLLNTVETMWIQDRQATIPQDLTISSWKIDYLKFLIFNSNTNFQLLQQCVHNNKRFWPWFSFDSFPNDYKDELLPKLNEFRNLTGFNYLLQRKEYYEDIYNLFYKEN